MEIILIILGIIVGIYFPLLDYDDYWPFELDLIIASLKKAIE